MVTPKHRESTAKPFVLENEKDQEGFEETAALCELLMHQNTVETFCD